MPIYPHRVYDEIMKTVKKIKPLKGTSHSDQSKQLKRVEGQVRGIIKMIEDQRYCVDILTQLKAVKASISSIERKIFDEHLNHCVHSAIDSKDPKKANEKLDEIRELLKSARL